MRVCKVGDELQRNDVKEKKGDWLGVRNLECERERQRRKGIGKLLEGLRILGEELRRVERRRRK